MTVFGPNAAAMLTKNALGVRNDPYASYRFLLEIEGMVVGGFTEIEGLTITTEVETIREGGANNIEYKLPKVITYSDLTLKYGVTDFDFLSLWYSDVVAGKIKRKNGTIYLLGQNDIQATYWNFLNAWPTKWEGPRLDANSNVAAIQTLVLAHQGLMQPKSSKYYSLASGIAQTL